MRLFKKQNLSLFLFCLLTLGNAYPYSDLYQNAFAPQVCQCCLMKEHGCPHCQKYGHKYARKDLDNSHKSAKGESVVDELPCSTSNHNAVVQFVSDPFLIPDYSVSRPLLILAWMIPQEQAWFSKTSQPDFPPPKMLI